MPIEIRELVIRAVVGPAPDSPGAQPLQGEPASDGERGATVAPEDFDRLVQACVRQVLTVLARERER